MSGLKAARRARGWSQARLVHEIWQRRAIGGLKTATKASLTTYVSEWENNKRPIGEEYRRILRSIFGLTDSELFASPAEAHEALDVAYSELAQRIDESKSIDLSMVGTLTEQTELFRSVDRQMGAASLGDPMRAHIATLENALAYAVLPSARKPVAKALSSAATLAGWQALDVGAVDRAWRDYELARRAAGEAQSPALIAHAMGEQAYVLVDAGKPELSFELIGEAIAIAQGKAPDRLLSWLYAAKSQFAAILSRSADSHRALELAEKALPAGLEMRDSEVPGVFLNGAHLTRWRGNVLALLGDDGAVDALNTALEGMDGTFTRAEGSLRIDLAQAYLAKGKLGDAEDQARRARALASRTGSLRNRRRLDRLMLEISASG